MNERYFLENRLEEKIRAYHKEPSNERIQQLIAVYALYTEKYDPHPQHKMMYESAIKHNNIRSEGI